MSVRNPLYGSSDAPRDRTKTTVQLAQLFGKSQLHVHQSNIYASRETESDDDPALLLGGHLHPHNPSLRVVRWSVACIGICHALWTLFEMTFVHAKQPAGLMVFDLVVDSLYIMDAVLVLHTGVYVQSTNEIVTQRSFVIDRFVRKHLCWYLGHSLPWQLLHYFLVPRRVSYEKGYLLKALRCLKALRLTPLYATRDTSRMSIVSSIACILLRFTVTSHIVACIVFAATFFDEAKGGPTWRNNLCVVWEMDYGCTDHMGASWMYAVSLYYAVTITTSVGFGAVFPYSPSQLALHCVACAVGGCHNAFLIAQIMSAVEETRRDRRIYVDLLQDALQFCTSRNLPKPLQTRLLRDFDHRWARTRCVKDEDSVLADASPQVKYEVLNYIYVQPLRKTSTFADIPIGILHEMIRGARMVFSRKGDILCTKGELAATMYVVVSGQLAALDDDDEPELIYKTGDVFGEHAYTKEHRLRSKTVRAEKHSQLIAIKYSILKELDIRA